MKTNLIIFAAFLPFLSSSCKKVTGEGPTIEETRSFSGFTSLSAGIDGDVYYTPASDYKVTLSAQSNILDIIETKQRNGELSIFFKNVSVGRHSRITAYIEAPSLESLNLSGSGRLQVTHPLEVANLRLNVSGSGSIETPRIDTDLLTGQISGSGNITVLDGTSKSTSLEISGSGNINMLSVLSRTATVHISGSGFAKLAVTEQLNAHISGSGNVYYRGDPKMDVHISGSGSVKKW